MDTLILKVFDLIDEESGYYALQHKTNTGIAKKIIISELIAQLNVKNQFDKDIKFFTK